MCGRRCGLDRATARSEYQTAAGVPATTCDCCVGALRVPPSTTRHAPASSNAAQINAEDSQQPLHAKCTGIPGGELPRIRTWQCTSSPAPVHSGVPVSADPGQQWRHRSVTPMDLAGKHPAMTDSCECMGPITPAAAASQAAGSPGSSAKATAGVPASHCASGALGSAAIACAGSSEPSAQRAASAAALWRRIRSFMACVAASPLVHSALLSLELGGTHPLATEPGLPASEALQWTLAQLLAMHLKAEVAVASEHTVLACLWLLESVESVWRSPATVCLNDYLKHLAVFSPEAVVAITTDWKRSFRELREGVVAAQSDLLQRLDWVIRLNLVSEVKPCLDLLFKLQRDTKRGPAEAAASGVAAAAATREAWALQMHYVCVQVRDQAVHLRNPARTAQRRPVLSEVEEEAQLTPTKRQRVHHTVP